MPTAAAASKTTQRIERLTALAGEGNPNQYEREVATMALTRLLKRHAEQQPETAKSYTWTPNWQGAKYQETRDIYNLTLITKRIRDEIKLLRKLGKQAAAGTADAALKLLDPIGDAPADIKISVRQPHYGSITITLSNIPQEWGWRWGKRNAWDGDTCERWIATDALEALGRELNALANAYNYDNSDMMTDYFDRRYYLSVNACEPGCEYGTSIGHGR